MGLVGRIVTLTEKSPPLVFRLADDLEIGAAAVIHPDSAAVVAPAIALAAGRIATLLEQPDSASGVSGAVVTVHVVRCAGNDLVLAALVAIPIAVTAPAAAATFDCEISPATVVHPDAPAVRSPTVAFPAGRLATLLHQADSAS